MGGGPVAYDMRIDAAVLFGLAILAVAALWPVVTCDFVNYDDHLYLTDNPRVQDGLTLANIAWAFTQAVGYWDPIDLLSHMLDCQFFGMNPSGHHAANLLYHVCNTVLLFVLLRRTTGQPWCSAFAAGLFAIHPQNVEPVAWISGRRDVLSTLLGLLALLGYARYAARPGFRRYVPVAVLLISSLMVKPAFMPFPAVLLFLDYWPLKRMEGLKVSSGDGRRRLYRLVFEKIPLFAIVCGFAALDFVTQRRIGALGSSEAHPFASRLANAAASYLMYIWRAFWPTHLAACYPYPAFSWWKIAGALTLLAALTTAAVLGRKRFPYVFTGWFWYALVLTPVSGLIVQVGNAPRADRYAYVSTIGLFVASAWGLGAVARRWRRTAVAIPVSVVAALGMYAMVANVQVRHWSDSVTLFRHALDVTADNYLACEFLGKTLADQGHDEDAIAAFNDSLRIAPGFADAHNNLGNVLLRNRRYPEAVSHFTEALRTSPRDAIILYNMGLALFSQSKDDDAILYFRKAIAAKPDFPLAHNNLGYALARKGAIEEAVAEYREALRIEPTSSLALYNLGDALRAQGHCQEAIPYYTRAAEADPQKRHEALNRIGETLVRQGKSDEAIACFRQAIAAKPDFTPAHNNLGQELARKGSFADAIAEYREVLKIAPQNATALNGLRAAGNAMQNPRR